MNYKMENNGAYIVKSIKVQRLCYNRRMEDNKKIKKSQCRQKNKETDELVERSVLEKG